MEVDKERDSLETNLSGIEPSVLLGMYRAMKLSRGLEEALIQAANSGQPVRVGHPYIGQEAVGVGVCTTLQQTDYVTSGHRSHGHAIAKGIDPKLLMAELFGKVDGVCGGKSGEMEMADYSVGFMGSTEIVAGNTAMATGLALGAKLQSQNRVAVCFIGDGATNQGVLHESMNLASIWLLPIIYVCDNNRYAESTPIEYSLSVRSFADRAPAYNMPGVTVDGQDVVAVYRAASELVARARRGEGPAAMDAQTYRYHGHYYGDRHQRYRSGDEVEQFRSRDAIATFRDRLLRERIASERSLDAIDNEVAQVTAESVAFAAQSAYPSPDAASAGVYAS